MVKKINGDCVLDYIGHSMVIINQIQLFDEERQMRWLHDVYELVVYLYSVSHMQTRCM